MELQSSYVSILLHRCPELSQIVPVSLQFFIIEQVNLTWLSVVFICHGMIDHVTNLMNMFQLLVVYKA